MIHILFGDSPAGSLKVALKNSGRSPNGKSYILLGQVLNWTNLAVT